MKAEILKAETKTKKTNALEQQRRGWNKISATGSCKFPTEFRQTAGGFRQRKLWLLKISFLRLNYPHILHFGGKCSDN